jgi:hypothetical protein
LCFVCLRPVSCALFAFVLCLVFCLSSPCVLCFVCLRPVSCVLFVFVLCLGQTKHKTQDEDKQNTRNRTKTNKTQDTGRRQTKHKTQDEGLPSSCVLCFVCLRPVCCVLFVFVLCLVLCLSLSCFLCFVCLRFTDSDLFSQNHKGVKLDWKKIWRKYFSLICLCFFFFPIKYKFIVYRNVWGSETVNRRKKDKETSNDLHKKSL